MLVLYGFYIYNVGSNTAELVECQAQDQKLMASNPTHGKRSSAVQW